MSRGIPIEDVDDIEVDEEILTEEQFLMENDNMDETDNEDNSDREMRKKDIKDELNDHLDAIVNPTEGEVKILSNIAKNRAKGISKKMETISVAPGETGTFQN